MTKKRGLRSLLSAVLLCVLAGCGVRPAPGRPLDLAAFSQNSVSVKIALELDSTGQAWLAATFTPQDPGYHLYSKDLPRQGLNGLGRPTLLDLVPGSRILAAGALSESVASEQREGPAGVLEYPAGPVTLRLPIHLPAGTGWFDEQVSVTYMACSESACKPPVQNKLVPVRVPGAEQVNS